MENFIIKNRINIIIYTLVFIIIVCVVVIINLANGIPIAGITPGVVNSSNSNTNSAGSTTSSYNANAFSYGEQDPNLIKDIFKALPYISDEFRVTYDASTKTFDVVSTVYGVQELQHVIIYQWLKDFPSLDYEAYTWVYHATDQP